MKKLITILFLFLSFYSIGQNISIVGHNGGYWIKNPSTRDSVQISNLTKINANDFGFLTTKSAAANTTAWKKIMDSAVARSGANIIIPTPVYPYNNGIYNVDTLLIPYSTTYITIAITGDQQPSFEAGTIGAFALPNVGVILKSLHQSGSIIMQQGSPTDFSATNLIVSNLELRTYSNPKIGGIIVLAVEYNITC